MSFSSRDWRYLALSLGVTALLVGAYVAVDSIAGRRGPPAPPLAVTTTDIDVVSLSNLRGQIVVVEFFATWCGPCEAVEATLLDALADEPPFSVLAVGIDASEGIEVISAYKQMHALPWIAGTTTSEQVEAWEVYSIPRVFVVDASGRIAAQFVGPMQPQALRDALLMAAR